MFKGFQPLSKHAPTTEQETSKIADGRKSPMRPQTASKNFLMINKQNLNNISRAKNVTKELPPSVSQQAPAQYPAASSKMKVPDALKAFEAQGISMEP